MDGKPLRAMYINKVRARHYTTPAARESRFAKKEHSTELNIYE